MSSARSDNRRQSFSVGLTFLVALFLPAIVYGQESWAVSGHAKLQSGLNSLNKATQAMQSADVRLNLKNDFQEGSFEMQAELLALDSAFPEQADGAERRRLFDFSARPLWGDQASVLTRLDRVSYAHQFGELNARVGRQALTWGNGLAFSVMDLVNPFAPTAIDKEYKTGEDLAWLQWTGSDSNDVQVYVLPRRDVNSHAVQAEESTFAVKWHTRSRDADFDLLFAQHYDRRIFGIGFNRALLQAMLRCDVTMQSSDEFGAYPAALCNVDRSWTIAGKNVYGFLEFFHNDIGRAAGLQFGAAQLLLGLERGEYFGLDKDYAAMGLRVELHPLLNWHVSEIRNIRDASAVAQTRFVYDAFQDIQLMLGVDVPHGPAGSEFGGYSVPGVYSVRPAPRVYLRGAWYF